MLSEEKMFFITFSEQRAAHEGFIGTKLFIVIA
jgi:hypothetical protein